MAIATLKIEGMTCGHCVRAVSEAIERQPGVEHAKVDLDAGRAVVHYDAATITPRALASAVMDEGYSAEELE
ncbi:MAG: cation transporter [Gemmatimonadetes bacterium]|nr:cation transporter [Gemmatimonadota bacterium]